MKWVPSLMAPNKAEIIVIVQGQWEGTKGPLLHGWEVNGGPQMFLFIPDLFVFAYCVCKTYCNKTTLRSSLWHDRTLQLIDVTDIMTLNICIIFITGLNGIQVWHRKTFSGDSKLWEQRSSLFSNKTHESDNKHVLILYIWSPLEADIKPVHSRQTCSYPWLVLHCFMWTC